MEQEVETRPRNPIQKMLIVTFLFASVFECAIHYEKLTRYGIDELKDYMQYTTNTAAECAEHINWIDSESSFIFDAPNHSCTTMSTIGLHFFEMPETDSVFHFYTISGSDKCYGRDYNQKDDTRCESGWRNFREHCYRIVVAKSKSFDVVSQECGKFSAHLSSIHGEIENIFLTELVRSYNTSGLPIIDGSLPLIGARGSKSWRDQLKWTDGTDINFVRMLIEGEVKACAVLRFDEWDVYPGHWGNIDCDGHSAWGICKKPA